MGRGSAVLWMVVIFGTSCLPRYRVPEIQPRAELIVAVQNDSQGTTLRTVYLDVFKDEECQRHQYGMRATSKMANDSIFATDVTSIAAGGRFVFSATYMDARFAQNRSCAATGAFAPETNHRYRAVLAVSGDVRSCTLGVYDVTAGTDAQIDFSMPAHVCTDEGKSQRPNGRPVWRNWQAPVVLPVR